MIALNLRLRRSFIIIWCLALWAFLAVFPPAYENYYPTAGDREAFVLGMQRNAGMTAMWGPVESPATLGQIVMWEAGSMMIILGSVMAVLLIVGLEIVSRLLYVAFQLRGEEHIGAYVLVVPRAIVCGIAYGKRQVLLLFTSCLNAHLYLLERLVVRFVLPYGYRRQPHTIVDE